jgi:uncharacterized membrane protein
MTTAVVLLALGVFGACCIESVEALTIVLAAGTRSWRSAITGALTAVVVLLIAGSVAGYALVHYVPMQLLHLTVGAVLLYYGVQWLRKAILRATGRKAKHDEDAIYERIAQRRDATAFKIALQGVLVEGSEVLIIVLGFGTTAGRLGVAAVAAVAAVVLVTLVGIVVARQLREVPENTIKFVVGVLLTSFGAFYFGEGLHVPWPGADLMLLALIAVVTLTARTLVHQLKVVR